MSAHKIENGQIVELRLANGRTLVAGFNVVNDVPLISYLPTTNDQIELGSLVEIGAANYIVVEVRRSEAMPRMIVVELEEGPSDAR